MTLTRATRVTEAICTLGVPAAGNVLRVSSDVRDSSNTRSSLPRVEATTRFVRRHKAPANLPEPRLIGLNSFIYLARSTPTHCTRRDEPTTERNGDMVSCELTTSREPVHRLLGAVARVAASLHHQSMD